MGKVVVVLFAIVGMVAWIFMWVWLFLFGLEAGAKLVNPISTYIQRQWLTLKQWLRSPSHATATLQWTVRILAIAAIYFAFTIDSTSWLKEYRGEIAGIAFTVLVIEEVGRLRDKIEFKDSIIRQMASRSNDFALDAARVAENEGWLADGSLRGVDLSEANLQGARLFEADLRNANLLLADLRNARLIMAKLQDTDLYAAKLQNANLFNANLQNANLKEAHLQDANLDQADLTGTRLDRALYSFETNWSKGFDYKAAGARLDFHEEELRATVLVYTATGWTRYGVLREEPTTSGIVLTVVVGQEELLELKNYPAIMQWQYAGITGISVQEGKFTVFDISYKASPSHLRYLAPHPVAFGKVSMVGLFR